MTNWVKIKKSHPVAVALANRHYSRIAFGKQGVSLGPPGRLVCYLAQDQTAVWVSHWPYAHLALDHLDAYRCTMFRNEGPTLSSIMIKEAMRLTQDHWGAQPADEWITWVAPDLTASNVSGWCFRRAGWYRDRLWKPSRRDVRLERFRSHLLIN